MADIIFAMIFRRIIAKVKQDVLEHFEIEDEEEIQDYKLFYDINPPKRDHPQYWTSFGRTIWRR